MTVTRARQAAFWAAAVIAGSAPAIAGDSNGNIQIRAGISGVIFADDVKSIHSSVAGDLKAAASADAKIPDIAVPTAAITYFFNKNIAVEAICCAGHITAEGTGGLAGLGELADAWVLPPIVTLQYRFDRAGGFQPYVGAGVQWIHYWPSSGDNKLGATHVSISDSFGPAIQIGLDYDLGGGWLLNLDAKKAWADTTVKWHDTAGFGDVKAKVDVDPLWLTASLGYRFDSDELFGRRHEDSLK